MRTLSGISLASACRPAGVTWLPAMTVRTTEPFHLSHRSLSFLASSGHSVLMPALHLARIDLESGAISTDQQLKVRSAIVSVIAAIGGENRGLSRRRLRPSVLDKSSAGRLLRQQRELISGRWQGPLEVPAGSVIVCVGLGTMADDLATELLVRILRDQKIDARHMSVEDLSAAPPPNAADAVSIVYVVSAFPSEERERGDAIAPGDAAALPAGLHRGGISPRHVAAAGGRGRRRGNARRG